MLDGFRHKSDVGSEVWWSYWDGVDDCDRHHGCLSETQEAAYVVLILHVKKHFGQLGAYLKQKS